MTSVADDLEKKIVAALADLREAVSRYAPVTFASSMGAEDMVLTDLIYRNNLDIEIFSIDTGRLPQQTYALMAAADLRAAGSIGRGVHSDVWY